MSNLVEVKVPDIGDFDSVEVIEVLVKVGDVVKAEQSLITVESDKASMEIPSSNAGTVKAIVVKIGDKVKQGTVIMQVEEGATSAGAAASAAVAAGPAPVAAAVATSAVTPAAISAVSAAPPTPAPAAVAAAPAYTGTVDARCDLLVLGAGPGGYSAAFRAADLGLNVTLVERYATLGGVCLNVGCIPSKALLHTAAVLEEAQAMAEHGISFGKPKIDLDKLRAFKDGVIGKLTGGLAGMARARKVNVVRGVGEFAGPHHLSVTTDSGKMTIEFGQAIIAAGSQSVKLPFMPEDDRVVDSTGALLLRSIPKRMLIVGGGIIGLEMGTVYSALGARLDVVEMLDGLMQGADRDLVKVWQKMNAPRFDNIMLGTKTVGAVAKKDGIHVSFEGPGAPKEPSRRALAQRQENRG